MATPNHHIILFADVSCTGNHQHVFETRNLSDFNDTVSSFIILQGNWRFYFDNDRNHPMAPMADGKGKVVGPGIYHWIEDTFGQGTNDKLSCVEAV